ncbi:hypothetical protein D9M70_387980 [compost metagenome]
MPCRLRTHAGGQLAHLVERFAPQRIDVGMLAGDLQCRFRGAAEIDRHMRLLRRLDLGKALRETVKLAGMVERLRLGPDAAQDVQVLVGARVTQVMVEVIAVALLLAVGAAGNEMHAQASAAELIERGDLARRQRGRGKAWPVRQHEMDALGHARGIGDGQRGRRPGRMVRHQDAVEAGLLVRLRKGAHIVAVDHGARRRMDLGLLLALDHADEIDAHAYAPDAVMAAACRPGLGMDWGTR